jgi:transcriptional repressor NrdR
MKCNLCDVGETKVIESRDVSEGQAIRRRRMCLSCNERFTTYERVEQPQLVVIKNDGTRQLFSRTKLLNGLYSACEKTPVTTMQLEQLVSEIERDLNNCGAIEIPSRQIGEKVMDRLSRLNEVAYVRFASVYRRFKDIASFEKELSQMRKRREVVPELVKEA